MKALLFAVAFAALLQPTVAAAAVGEWFTSEGVKLRLVSLRDGATGKLHAALQIVLEPGWKTYWRSPGSSGLPPQLDFSQSQNVSGAEVSYPTPITFSDGAGLTSGYKEGVVLPVEVKTPFPQRDVMLKVQGLIGVCDEICIPLQFSTELTDRVSGGSSFEAAQVLAQAQASLPGKASNTMQVLSAKPRTGMLDVIASVPSGSVNATLFLEGPPVWYLSAVKANDISHGRARFSVEIPANIEPSSAVGRTLRATLVVDGKGVEHEIDVH